MAGSALVNVRLLRVRSVGVSSAALFLTGACLYGAMFLIPQGAGSLLTRTVAGRLTDRIGAPATEAAATPPAFQPTPAPEKDPQPQP